MKQVKSHSPALSMAVEQFNPSQYSRGEKHAILLELHAAEPELNLPVLLLNGSSKGKTLVVTAGVHGDEYEGVRAILDLCSELDPGVMRGTLIAVPVANPPAFWNGTRTSPLDNANLARTFPGREHGSFSQKLAFHLGRSIIVHADFFVDLHSAGVKLLMPTMVGYDARDPRSCEAARVFGAPAMWGHPTMKPGRTLSFAASRKIPWIYTEARGAGRIDPEDLRIFKNGLLNLMHHLGILPGPPTDSPAPLRLTGDGDIDSSISAKKSGFLVPSVELLETVRCGQELGRTLNLHGQLLESFQSPCDGVIGLIHAFP
ncbi:MAG: succinylglutamate desuccinylase/aspartoacylase family protein, partial [Candidatus Acidiferrales bacterium]